MEATILMLRSSPLFNGLTLFIAGVCAYFGTYWLVPKLGPHCIRASLFGYDLLKDSGEGENRKKVPESLGIVAATVSLVCISLLELNVSGSALTAYNAALASVALMVCLGFADDVLDLRWAVKIVLSAWATLPLLCAYWAEGGPTNIIVPVPFRGLLGYQLELGILYLVYMLLWTVFCTNSINIYAGVNGLEVGQSVVIALAVLVHNMIEISNEAVAPYHFLSACFIVPFLGASLGLLYHNWYPSDAFVGDTYTYFAGMSLAVAAILGHHTKTLMLFFVPQLINFAISLPQLFRLVPCPRHRMPRLNKKTGLITASRIPETNGINYTLINVWLWLVGDRSEARLTTELLLLQAFFCFLGFMVRYQLAHLFYF